MRIRRTARVARASFRAWWPELLCAGLLAAVAFAGQPDDFLFAVFCAIIGAIFWAMGYRHRLRSLHEKVDLIPVVVREELRAAAAETREGKDESPRPRLRLIHHDQGKAEG